MKWEYKWLYVYPSVDTRDFTEKWEALQSAGRDGWELVSVDHGYAYLRRPISN